VEAWPYFTKPESVAMFTKHKVFSEEEMHARLEIVLEKYSKQINIEAGCACEMATREILPVCASYAAELAGQAEAIASAGGKKDGLQKRAVQIASLVEDAFVKSEVLASARLEAKGIAGALAQAQACRDRVFPAIEALREPIDKLEKLMPKDYWPMPTYEELLFGL
jgi:glutamine synthetase